MVLFDGHVLEFSPEPLLLQVGVNVTVADLAEQSISNSNIKGALLLLGFNRAV